ncbi:sporulation-control protein [Bacillus ectoiniformans]|uniref:sporulation protein n=1 Tax=Bacillus ectoiniformans TaxID=1494429 RepID=UPI00195B9CF6|nr:sporulation protein [Bacillus ectoiniformans]MBM7647895.1 sporulation-control protein [Bacillus ectoiniformans]
MSFFNKVLASFGVGGAKVDTKLEKSSYVAGERMAGEVRIDGGNIEQHIDSIYLTIYTTYVRESDDKKYTDFAAVKKTKLNDPFTIGANESKVIPFTIDLPYETPITFGNTRVWVQTGLDIKNAVDPEDKDYIEVRPTHLMTKVLDGVEGLGFRLRQVECEQASLKIKSRYPFIQEFEFVPTSGLFRGRLDELELVFLSQTDDQAELLFEVDRKARGFGGFLAEALEMDESLVRTTITVRDLPMIDEKLKQIIAKYA